MAELTLIPRKVIFSGVGPLFIIPLANTYGRRPIYLGGNLLAAITNIAAGNCSSWSGLLATRVFNGIAAGSTVAIGAVTICDLYFLHERGLFMGVYTFFLTNGKHSRRSQLTPLPIFLPFPLFLHPDKNSKRMPGNGDWAWLRDNRPPYSTPHRRIHCPEFGLEMVLHHPCLRPAGCVCYQRFLPPGNAVRERTAHAKRRECREFLS